VHFVLLSETSTPVPGPPYFDFVFADLLFASYWLKSCQLFPQLFACLSAWAVGLRGLCLSVVVGVSMVVEVILAKFPLDPAWAVFLLMLPAIPSGVILGEGMISSVALCCISWSMQPLQQMVHWSIGLSS